MTSERPEKGVEVEVLLSAPASCSRCEAVLLAGTSVVVWKSSYGPEYDRISACPACKKPESLINLRQYLADQVPPGSAYSPEQLLALQQNWDLIIAELFRLYERLPVCTECETRATHQLPHGPLYCDLHAADHPTASEVSYAKELRRLGI